MAIAALICSLIFFIPTLSVLGVIFGIVALRQISRTPQNGKGMAITGIVIGTLVSLFWGLGVVAVITANTNGTSSSSSSSRDSGTVKTDGRIRVDKLTVGQCFDGVKTGRMTTVQAKKCTEPHQAEVYTEFTLPDAPWPGDDEAASQAEDGCNARADNAVKASVIDDLELFYLYPNTSLAWRLDRKVLCIGSDPDGKLTTSMRK
jgi:hypothetical protein